ncbi:hypothetical protein Nepgr_013012 [Nepenthes gracilis]|uniref:Uncharacterized protein n=1 Tax=Nepenthes gracilis TaxID=150966 RepID=A0AAD3SIJ0_NEPGR|nr:hypothetical protein Nepgr_013012 [Nepenthes gracilis]
MTLKQPPQVKPCCASACHRHPSQPATGLCTICLREPLSLLNPSGCPETSQSNFLSRPSIDISAASCNGGNACSSASTLPELRRCMTVSGSNFESNGVSYVPRGRSCEVRRRNLDDEGGDLDSKCEIESKNLELPRGTWPILETKEEENEDDNDEIGNSHDETVANANLENSEHSVDELGESKTIRELMDLESRCNKPIRRDFKEIAGSFCTAASVFSRKFQKWSGKDRNIRSGGDGDAHGGHLGEMRLERLKGRRIRDMQSEIGDCRFGRRSCDTDPRCSVDNGGRISVDLLGRRSCDTDSRFSIDLGRSSVDGNGTSAKEASCSFIQPRASWDGHFTWKTMARDTSPMVSVTGTAMGTVNGVDSRSLVESMVNEDEADFMRSGHLNGVYLRRPSKSFDSKRNIDDDTKLTSNAMVSPAGIEIFHGTKLLTTEKELKDLRLNSLVDDSSESFESASKDVASVSSNSDGKGFKKCRQWSKLWRIWGFLHGRKYDTSHNGEKFNVGNAGCSLAHSSEMNSIEVSGDDCYGCGPAYSSETTTAIEVNGEVSSDTNWKLLHGCRTNTVPRPVHRHSTRTETKGLSGKNREEVVLQRSRSARYTLNNHDNGLLRFHLTPLKCYRRSKLGRRRSKKSHSTARTVLSFY